MQLLTTNVLLTSNPSQPGPDPWINLDGRLNAPTGAPQLPNLLNQYHPSGPPDGRYFWPSNQALDGVSGNFRQPQWHVAGVDYAVGPRFTPTTDPATLSLPGVTVNTGSRSVIITGNNVTLSGIDFSLHSGYQVTTSGGPTGWLITDCNFALGTNTGAYLAAMDGSGTIQYCTMDAFTQGNESSLVLFNGTTLMFQYNLLKNFPQHVIEFASSSVTPTSIYKYNLILNGGYSAPDSGLGAGAHLNFLQNPAGAMPPATTSHTVQFNTTVQFIRGGGEGFQFEGTSGTPATADCSFNTMVNPANAGYTFGMTGSATNGDIITLTFTGAGLAGSPISVSHTVSTAETLTAMASGLVTAINANATLTGAGLTAHNDFGLGAVPIVFATGVCTAGTYTLSASVSGAATEVVNTIDNAISTPIHDGSGTDSYTCNFNQNYFDSTGINSYLSGGKVGFFHGSPTALQTYTGNVDMVTGATATH